MESSIRLNLPKKGEKMTEKSKIQKFTDLLKDLEAATGIEAFAVASKDGFMIASTLSKDAEKDRAATISAALLSLGEMAAKELARGELSEIYVKGENGSMVLVALRKNAVLTVLAGKDANLTLVFPNMKKTAEELEKMVWGGNPSTISEKFNQS